MSEPCNGCLMGSTVLKEILFYRLMAHIIHDLTSPCWNQLHYLPQIIVSAGCSFLDKITDLSICGEVNAWVC